jgi:hypothetical protein
MLMDDVKYCASMRSLADEKPWLNQAKSPSSQDILNREKKEKLKEKSFHMEHIDKKVVMYLSDLKVAEIEK